ncbi:MAG: hypothetical protein ACTSV7_03340 [Candidatus Baldrarchaeia archaeon]
MVVKHHNTVTRALRYLIGTNRISYDPLNRTYYCSVDLRELFEGKGLPEGVSYGKAFCRVSEHPVDNIVPFLCQYARPKQIWGEPLTLEWIFPCTNGHISVTISYHIR